MILKEKTQSDVSAHSAINTAVSLCFPSSICVCCFVCGKKQKFCVAQRASIPPTPNTQWKFWFGFPSNCRPQCSNKKIKKIVLLLLCRTCTLNHSPETRTSGPRGLGVRQSDPGQDRGHCPAPILNPFCKFDLFFGLRD